MVFNCDTYEVYSEYLTDDYGITLRKGQFKNTSNKNICLNSLMSKFIFDGGEYEVYSQFNGWQNESAGMWQPLVTTVKLESNGVRSCTSAAPFVVLWSKQTNRGMAFHLVSRSAWEMSVTNSYAGGETAEIVVEAGMSSRNLMMNVAPGETVDLPDIIYYEVRNKIDLDCYKIHNYLNTHFPRKDMPVIYNTWLYKFDDITYQNVECQISRAAELGADYFVIDAGWFGNGSEWETARGDWEENLTGALAGKMKDISNLVKASGMKFGFWLEVESANKNSKSLANNREYFLNYNDVYLIDFANPKAVDYIYNIVDGLINKYSAEFIKFDFNQNIPFDNLHCAFTGFYDGHKKFLDRLRENHPEVYLDNCASGGMRTNISTCMDFDSIWMTDNQSPYDTLRIYKNTLLRMQPQMLEKWASFGSLSGFWPTYHSEPKPKIISTDDATWDRPIGIDYSFLEGFFLGSAMGLSCDLRTLSDDTFKSLKSFILRFKANKDFWKSAVCRVLTDTKSMLVLQYSDMEFKNVKLLVFSFRMYQKSIEIYPVLDETAQYVVDESIINGKNACLSTDIENNYRCKVIELKKI